MVRSKNRVSGVLLFLTAATKLPGENDVKARLHSTLLSFLLLQKKATHIEDSSKKRNLKVVPANESLWGFSAKKVEESAAFLDGISSVMNKW